MGAINVRIEGIEEVVAELERRGLNAARALEGICTAGAVVVEEAAKQIAGGSIGDAMMHETTGRSAQAVEVSVGPSDKAWYAKFIEFGTKAHPVRRKARKALLFNGVFRPYAQHPGTSARPFLRPAVDTRRDEVEKAMADKTKDALGL